MIRTAGIVGCGVGGMSAALALAREGVEVTLIEAFERPQPLGSGLLLQPAGLAALRSLGLEHEVRAAGAVVRKLEGRDLAGRVVLDLDYRYWRRDAHGLGIHRGALFRTLYEAVGRAGVRLVTGAQILRVEEHARPVLVDHAGRSFGPFDLAVIADGSASGLRSQVRPQARAPVYPWGAVWANCADPDEASAGVLAQVYHRAEVMAGVLPIGRGVDADGPPQVSLFWSMPADRLPEFFAGDFDAWKRQVLQHWPRLAPLLDRLSDHGQLAPANYRDVRVGRWCRDACLIIGDAAHGTSPQLGQGANMALIDAAELGAAARDRRPVPHSILRYQASRRRHTALYQLASRALTPMFQSDSRYWVLVRDWLFAPLSRAPGIRWLAASILTGALRLGRFPEGSRP